VRGRPSPKGAFLNMDHWLKRIKLLPLKEKILGSNPR
jgi:hypothetical protein